MVVQGAVVRANTATSLGGGLYVAADAVVLGSTITENLARAGGGLYVDWTGSVVVTDSDLGYGAVDNQPDDVATPYGYGAQGASDLACNGYGCN